jgi:hypothetical protein
MVDATDWAVKEGYAPAAHAAVQTVALLARQQEAWPEMDPAATWSGAHEELLYGQDHACPVRQADQRWVEKIMKDAKYF